MNDVRVARVAVPVGAGEKAEWNTPRLARLDACDAELGINPLNPEGQFAEGS